MMLKTLLIISYRLCLLVLSLLVLYQLIPFKISEIQSITATESSANEGEFVRALQWNPRNKLALTHLAELSKGQGDFKSAEKYALAALESDPTNGHAMSILVFVYMQLHDEVSVEEAVSLAPRQWSAHSYVHTTLADYWSKKGEMEKVLSEWDLLITRHRNLYKPIFPVLLSYANADNSRHLLTPYVTRPATWWNDFFTYMIRHKVSLPVLQYFYQQRMLANVPLEENERRAYVNRLQQAKLWKLAYSSWIGGLSGTEFSQIRAVFDGGFESLRHDTGYDWYFKQSKQAKIKLARTRGVEGKRGLHITFNARKSINFKNIWQRVLLEPGRSYQLSVQTRIDAIKNPQGLVWRVYCADNTAQLLAESQALKGREKWHEVAFEFTIPKQDCASQIVRLEAKSKYHHEHFFKGGIWFDELQVTPVKQADIRSR